MSTLSLCVINRNDSRNLSRLISSARKHVNEIVVVDTGSSDDSVSSARSAGADIVREAPELLKGGEIFSFSRARELSYELSTCQWQLWLDTDDDLPGWWDALGPIVARAEDDRKENGPGLAVQMWYDYSWTDDRSVCTQSFTRERITHRDDGWVWKRPVHEFLDRDGAVRYARVNNPRVVHLSQGARGIKNDRNLRILQHWWREGGEYEDPTALFYYLGDEMLARERFDEAVAFFDRVPVIGKGVWYERAQFRALRALYAAREFWEIRKRLACLIDKFPDVADFRWELARVLYTSGLVDDAKRALESSRGCREIEGENDQLRAVMSSLLGLA